MAANDMRNPLYEKVPIHKYTYINLLITLFLKFNLRMSASKIKISVSNFHIGKCG